MAILNTDGNQQTYVLNIQQNTAYSIRFVNAFTDINSIEFDADTFDESKVRFMISYSFDNDNWSPWSSDFVLTYAAIDTYKQTSNSVEVFIKLKITTTFDDEHDFYRLKSIKVNDVIADAGKFLLSELQTYRGITSDNSKNLFKPYANLDSSVDRLLAQTNKINDIFGHEVFYLKVNEVDESYSATFKEFENFKIESIKNIKVLVPNNDFKANKLIYSEFSIEYEEDFEVHIVIEAFERAFGVGISPQSRDIVYVPQIGRMYDIVSAQSDLQLNNTAVYTKCMLRKHVSMTDTNTDNVQNETTFNINDAISFEINAFENNIDSDNNTNVNNDPYLKIDDNNAQITGNVISDANSEGLNAQALQDYYYLSKHDAIRLYTHKQLTIANQSLQINKVPIFFRYYNATSIQAKTIQYKKLKIINKSQFLNFSCWFKVTDNTERIMSLHNIVLAHNNGIIELQDSLTNSTLNSMQIVNDDLWHHVSINIDLNSQYISTSLFEYNHINNEFILRQEVYCNFAKINISNIIDKFYMYGSMMFSNVKLYAKSINDDNVIALAIDRTFKIQDSLLVDTVFDIKI